MARREELSQIAIAKRSLIADYVRLSLSEGLHPGEAYKELKRKLSALKN